jgi:hypothetical protein
MTSPCSFPTSSLTALTRAAASMSGLGASKSSSRYGSVECEDTVFENVPEGDPPCSSSARSVDYWELLSGAKDKCLHWIVDVYTRLSIWAPNVERSCTCQEFSEGTMRALAEEYVDKGFPAAADAITRAATRVGDSIISVADNNSRANWFQHFILVRKTKSVSSADPVVMSSQYVGATRSSCPQSYVVLSWAKVRLRVDYAMACLVLFLALLVGVWAYDRRVGLFFLLVKVCGDLIVSRIDCSHAHALGALHEVCTVDSDGHVCIELSAFEGSV